MTCLKVKARLRISSVFLDARIFVPFEVIRVAEALVLALLVFVVLFGEFLDFPLEALPLTKLAPRLVPTVFPELPVNSCVGR